MSSTSSETNWHALPIAAVCERLSTSSDGLTQAEAESRVEQYGYNQLHEQAGTPPWLRFLLQFHNPLIYVLLATAAVTALLQLGRHRRDIGCRHHQRPYQLYPGSQR